MRITKHLIVLLCLSVLFYQCTNTNNGITIFGKWMNNSIDSLYVVNNYLDTIATTVCRTDGTFNFNIDNGEEDYYFIQGITDNNSYIDQPIYLSPGDNLLVSVDSLTFVFSGDGAQRNQYLYERNINWYNRWLPFYGEIDKGVFYRDSVFNYNKEKVKTQVTNSGFIQRELKNIDYNYAFYLVSAQAGLDSTLLSDLKWAKSFEVNDTIELKRNKDYIALVAQLMAYSDTLSIKNLNDTYEIIDNKPFQDIFIQNMVGFMKPLAKQLSTGEDNYEKAMLIKKFAETNYPYFNEKFAPYFNVYEKFHDAEGEMASFSYEDVNGNLVNLSDFSGKYVYIDFWATWCSWCIKEFPYLDKLKAAFEGENLEFVSISINFEKEKQKWREFVVERNIEGIQLIASLKQNETSDHTNYVDKGDIEDSFLKLLHINDFNIGIPQFSLIGPDGRIIDASAPRPSNKNIINYLNNYLK